MQDQDPFQIMRNYRQMISRRDRHQKKRTPKNYPPTSIRTRSMENHPKPQEPNFQGLDLPECYFAFITSSFLPNNRASPELCMIQENDKQARRQDSMDFFSFDQCPVLDTGNNLMEQENQALMMPVVEQQIQGAYY